MLTMRRSMPHSCGIASRFLEARRTNAAVGIRALMQARQRIIADWMQAMIERHELSARSWADKAGLGKDTVSRALRDDYQHVTKATTVARLAEVINEKPPGAAAAIPSTEVLSAILEVLVEALPGARRLPSEAVQVFAASLRDTLLHLADEPESESDPRVPIALARASVRQRGQQSG